MRRALLLLLAAVSAHLWTPAAVAQPVDIPGIEADASAYLTEIRRRIPAGGTPAQRQQAAQAARTAAAQNNVAALITALENQIGYGADSPTLWLDLARANLRRTPPDARRALGAAWQNFMAVPAGPPEIPSLLVIADALALLNREAQQISVLEAVTARAPENAQYRQRLADARRAAGLLVARVRTEAEVEPARACIEFAGSPAVRADIVWSDWVRAEPAIPGLAVTREGTSLCVTGLPLGATTRLTLREGLPGEDGVRLNRAATLNVAMGDRNPRLILNTSAFVLPRGQDPRVTLAAVNMERVRIQLVRITERALVNVDGGAVRSIPTSWRAESIAEYGRIVWEGGADLARGPRNQILRTALPLPAAIASSGPGLFALVVFGDDGGASRDISAMQLIQHTDIALTGLRGGDGLTVLARGFADARPRAGLPVRVLARNNDILAEGTTDADGAVRFAAPLLRGEGPIAPVQVHAFGPNDDFAALELESAAFDLSDRGVEGRAHPGPTDAFVWTERGIYRPGETVRLRAIVRDAAGAPSALPVRVTVSRPSGQVFLQTAAPAGPDASFHLPVQLSAGAVAGTWRVTLHTDPALPPVGTASFLVDAFVPETLAVEIEATEALRPGVPLRVPVTARFLYGAPAAGLSGRAELRLLPETQPFANLPGFRFGLIQETRVPQLSDVEIAETDAQGRAIVTLNVPRMPDLTRPLRGVLNVEIDEPSGRASRATANIPVRAAERYIGIRPEFTTAVDANAEAGFQIVATDGEGQPVAGNLRLRLVRERPDWRILLRGSLARYELVYRDEPVDARELAVTAAAPARYAQRLGFGRYRLEVLDAGGMAATSVRFWSGWPASDDADVPDRVEVLAATRTVAPGEAARLRINPPFAGEAAVMVLTDRVHSLRHVTVPAAGLEIDVPMPAEVGPGAYVAVSLARPGGGGANSIQRAIGLAWVALDPVARTLTMAVRAPEVIRPGTTATVEVAAAPGALVTLAAVDEGVLRLTGYRAPDPVAHFLGRRTLGLDIRDDYGRLIAPADGGATTLRQGGDDLGEFALPEIPQRIVALSFGPVQAGSDGVARFDLAAPEFTGAVRLMAVAWQGNRVGGAEAVSIIRDRLVAEPLLPRFLAPGDEARISVNLHNLELPAGDMVAEVKVNGPLEVVGAARVTARLATGERATPPFTLRATGVGTGTISVTGRAPDGTVTQREANITIRPARGRVTTVALAEFAPGREYRLEPAAQGFLPGTWRAQATFGAVVRFDPAALMRALEEFALACLEQTVSAGLPLALLPDGDVAGPQRAARLQRAVESVLDRQRYDGSFGLWSVRGEPAPWLSMYATEFLLRARAAGAAVGEAALENALRYAAEQADDGGSDAPALATASYAVHVLAMANRPRAGSARILFEALDRLPTPLSRAQLGAALARLNDRGRAETAFAAALQGQQRNWWRVDYGSVLRDTAAIAVLLREADMLTDRLPALVNALPGPNLNPNLTSTQEQAWAVAAAAVLGRDGRPVQVTLDGRPLAPAPFVLANLTGAATVVNQGERIIFHALTVSGVPTQAPAAARNGLRVSRRFLTATGQPLNLDQLRQNTVFFMVVEGGTDAQQEHEAMLLAGLPAGWEVVARYGGGIQPGLGFLGELTETASQPALDDRFAAAIDIPARGSFRLAVRLRAVTAGRFELPGAELSDMYRPTFFARQAAGRVTILPPE